MAPQTSPLTKSEVYLSVLRTVIESGETDNEATIQKTFALADQWVQECDARGITIVNGKAVRTRKAKTATPVPSATVAKDGDGSTDTSTGVAAQKLTIADLGVSARVVRTLDEAGIKSIRRLKSKTLDEMKGVEGLGSRSLKLLVSGLESHGLAFKAA